MVNRNLIRSLEDENLTEELDGLFSGQDDVLDVSLENEADYTVNNVVEGRIIRVEDDMVLVDVGFKSEGTISSYEWDEDDPPEVGKSVQVLIEDVEDESGAADDPYGMVSLSKRKAEKIMAWTKMMKEI